MRPSSIAFTVLAGLAIAVGGCVLDAAVATDRAGPRFAAQRALAARLELTDIALFTEARYTRHPTQADLQSAFQDHPLAFEHFPSGSLLPPRHDALVRETTAPD